MFRETDHPLILSRSLPLIAGAAAAAAAAASVSLAGPSFRRVLFRFTLAGGSSINPE